MSSQGIMAKAVGLMEKHPPGSSEHKEALDLVYESIDSITEAEVNAMPKPPPPPNEDDFCQVCGYLKLHHGIFQPCRANYGSKYETSNAVG